jgi:chromosome segregation ATPase
MKEQREISSSYYLWNWSKEDFRKKVSYYVKKSFIDTQLETELKEIATLISKFNDLKDKREKLYQERENMTEEQNRLRENISVLGEDNQSVSLRERYIKKLNDQESRYEAISSELKTLDNDILKLNKEIDAKMNKLKA